MRLVFSYLKATRHASLFFGWELNGRDEKGEPVRLYVHYLENGPEPYLTYFEAKNITSELLGDMLVLLDETFVPESYRKDWDVTYNPDQPRHLAKTVTVK